jgi:hypothetical protein
MNALDPDQMTAAERLAEVADLMAAALIRRQQRKSISLSGDLRESSLDFSVDLRGHVVPNPNVGAAE